MQRKIAVVDSSHNLVAGLDFLESRGIVDLVIHGHGCHPALDLLAIDFEALRALIDRFHFAVEGVGLLARSRLPQTNFGHENGRSKKRDQLYSFHNSPHKFREWTSDCPTREYPTGRASRASWVLTKLEWEGRASGGSG